MDALAARFPNVSRAVWESRFARGRVLDGNGRTLQADSPAVSQSLIYYYREVDDEQSISGPTPILYRDEHLLVADKPSGLAVQPAGRYATATLLAELLRRVECPDLVPLHRIDRDTAGVVLFSTNPSTRADYHRLFAERLISKRYQAMAPALEGLRWPHTRCSRIVRGQPFFRMCEVDGVANSETRIERIGDLGGAALYELRPISGRKHQLRVHMSALGAAILGDRLYPECLAEGAGATHPKLQLLAHSVQFVDPINGQQRQFSSAQRLPLI